MDRSTAEAKLEKQILRQAPGADRVLFDEDGEHVYVGPVEGAVIRYRLGADAQRFLHGEFTEDEPPVEVLLHATEGGE